MVHRRDLTTEEIREAMAMINRHMAWGKVAKYFKINKPGLLKALGLWNTGIRKMPSGREYRMERGRVRLKGEAFEVKDLPVKT